MRETKLLIRIVKDSEALAGDDELGGASRCVKSEEIYLHVDVVRQQTIIRCLDVTKT